MHFQGLVLNVVRAIGFLCITISCRSAYSMQLALTKPSFTRSFPEKLAQKKQNDRKAFSEAMFHMVNSPYEVQLMIASELFNNQAPAVDKFVDISLEDKMRIYANSKQIYHKEALPAFVENAFDASSDNWREDVIFVLHDEIRSIGKILANPIIFLSNPRYNCNKIELEAFLVVADKFPRIKIQKEFDGSFVARPLAVAYRNAYTISNFLEKISELESEQFFAVPFLTSCMSAYSQQRFGKVASHFLGLPIWILRSSCLKGATLVIDELKRNVRGKDKGVICFTGALLGVPSFLLNMLFKDKLHAHAGALATYTSLVLLYNIKHTWAVKSKIFKASELEALLQNPKVVIQ